MKYTSFKKTAVIILFSILVISSSNAAEQGETAKLLTTLRPTPMPVTRDKIYMDANYEMSDVMVGPNTGHWIEFVNTFGYFHDKFFSYFYTDQYDRLGDFDYTANAGTYINIDKDQNCHFEAGFGWAVNYIYNLQVITEYSHRMYKNLFWTMGYNYRNYYDAGDVHVVYPGVILYFGDHYVSANWGTNFIENRDIGYTGTFKGDFAITNFLRCWGGFALGERLYDIFPQKSSKEFGYIIFSGLTFIIYKDISAKIGVSYSQEEPKFIKRSLNCALSVKF